MRHFLLTAAILPALLVLATPASAATSPESKACSDQATAKGLHGADREAFRASCLKAAAPAAPAKATPAAKAAAAPAAAKPASGASAASKACSDQATAKGLHGADRETFRNACLKGAPAPVVAAAPTAKPAAAAVKTAAPAAGAAAPRSDASKACSDQATAKGLHGAERETFRNACLKGAAPAVAAPVVAAAKPAPVAKAAPAPAAAIAAAPPEPGSVAAKAAKPASGTRSPAQLAADQRIHACGQQWQAAKAAGKIPAGQTWPKYWSACSARMKAA